MDDQKCDSILSPALSGPEAALRRTRPDLVPNLDQIVADHDHITPTDLALSAFEKARQSKQLTMLKGGHFTPCVKRFQETSSAAVNWFVDHLRPE